MSAYFTKGKGWRYDFTLKGDRYTKSGYKTKTEARQAEANRREELKNPIPVWEPEEQETLTDTTFLELVNKRLDHVKAYNSESLIMIYEQLGSFEPAVAPGSWRKYVIASSVTERLDTSKSYIRDG